MKEQTKFDYQTYISIHKNTTDTQEVINARKRLKKLKGYYVKVPNYNPPTKILVLEGQDEAERIRIFKQRHRKV